MKHCLFCKENVIGRSDKKFCSDDCRVHYHNLRNRNNDPVVRKINRILLRNRKILTGLMQSGQTIICRSYLLENGYDFRFKTHMETDVSGKLLTYCYDIAYFEDGGKWIQLQAKGNNKT